MILLDTNVVSGPLRRQPESRVVEWIDAQPRETLFLSTITVAELRAGVALLPAGARRARLQEALEHKVLPLFRGRVLAFDMDGTASFAELMARTRTRGVAIATAEACIAATAATHGSAVATRDVRPFDAAGIGVIDPWRA